MRSTHLLDNFEFHDEHPYAQPLYVSEDGRVIRFMLKPGQAIEEHNAPSSPFFAIILQGQGVFTGGDGAEQTCGPNTLLIFDAGENHSIRAIDELIFLGILHGSPLAQK